MLHLNGVYQTLNYFLSVLKNPAASDFIDMGYGIEARHRRAAKYWDKHLKFCREFQADALSDYQGRGKAAVLGAGSLLDVNLDLLRSKFSKISFYDANTSLKAKWKKNIHTSLAEFNFTDLTGSLDSWTKKLLAFVLGRKSEAEIAGFLNTLKVNDSSVLNNSYEVILSLNLLSQIPIYWRDRVHKIILRYTGIDTNNSGIYNLALQKALENSMRILQEQHVKLLSESGAETIILITDTEFMYYSNSKSEWQTEKALLLQDQIKLNGYFEKKTESWFWHIAPQGIEEMDYGAIHNVTAKVFSMS